MSLAGAGSSIVKFLRTQFQARHGGELQGLTFKLVSAAELREDLLAHVTWFLYRIDADVTRRHQEIPPTAPNQPARRGLALDLRYLLTVWGRDAEREQQVLGECMSILDETPILSGDHLDPTYTWPHGSNLRVALDHVGAEDLLRLWDALTPSFRLSVPYVVRTVGLETHALPRDPLVEVGEQRLVPRGRP